MTRSPIGASPESLGVSQDELSPTPASKSADLDAEPSAALSDWLDRLAKLAGYDSGQALVADTGLCCWMDFFTEGYSPGEAWAEECSDG